MKRSPPPLAEWSRSRVAVYAACYVAAATVLWLTPIVAELAGLKAAFDPGGPWKGFWLFPYPSPSRVVIVAGSLTLPPAVLIVAWRIARRAARLAS